jgi:hypothetical protein
MCSDAGKDFIGAKVLFRELLGWSGGSEILSLDIDMRSDWHFRSGKSFPIRVDLVTFLSCSNVLLEFLVQFFKVYGEIPSFFRCDISFWMDGEVGVVTLVGIEGG